MGSEWQRVSVEEIRAKSKGAIAIGPFGSRMKSDRYVESGVPVIRGTNITGGPTFEGDFVFVSEGMADSLGSCNVYEGDLVFPHRGAIGEVGIVPPGGRYVISSSLMKLTCDRSQAVPRFLYYFFRSHVGRHELLKNASQVGTPGIGQPLTSLRSITLTLPAVPEQRAIAHILGTLDDKIELNRRMNETLETMAQALFKSWFVDFDPVIDKALTAGNPIPEPLQKRAEARMALGDRRKPLPASIAQHFPDRFVFNEDVGWIPDRWELTSIYKLVDVVYGAPFSSKRFNSEGQGKPIIRIRDLKTGSPQVWSDELHPKGTMISAGDVVVGMDAEFRATIWPGEDGYLNQRLFFARPIVTNLSGFYIQQILEPLLAREERAQVGTTVAHLGKRDIDKFIVLEPGEKVRETFSGLVRSILQRWVVNQRQTSTLSVVRDTLLPKLLSGELRIPDAEEQAEKAL